MKKTWHGSEFMTLFTRPDGKPDIDQKAYRIIQIEAITATGENGRPVFLAEIAKRED